MTSHQCCTDAVDSVVKQQQFPVSIFSGLCRSLYTVALRELHVGFSLTLAQVVPNSCCHGTSPATQHDADLLVRCPSPIALSPSLSCATWWLLRPSQPVQPRQKISVALKVFHCFIYTHTHTHTHTHIYIYKIYIYIYIYVYICNSYICSASYTKNARRCRQLSHILLLQWTGTLSATHGYQATVETSPGSNRGLRPWFDGGAQNDGPVHDRMC